MKLGSKKKSPASKTSKKTPGSKLHIAIILPRFNDELGMELYQNTEKQLKKLGVKTIKLYRTPGALELPFAAYKIAQAKKYDAIIALGIVIRGETKHFDLVCEQAYTGLMEVNLDEDTPVIFGVLAVENKKQAIDRVRADRMDKGSEFAEAAVEMAQFRA